jgi:PqqD family protein of HPr-rel-A system
VLTAWRLRDPSSLRWRRWEDGFVLFHAPSGDTHLLEHAAGEAILLLTRGPNDAAGLARELGAEEGGDVARAIGDVLERFHELGVVERA